MGQKDRLQFSCPISFGAPLRPVWDPHPHQATVTCWWSSASVFTPAPRVGAWNVRWYEIQSGPVDLPPGGLWWLSTPPSSTEQTDLDTATPSLTSWLGVKYLPIQGLPPMTLERVPVVRNNEGRPPLATITCQTPNNVGVTSTAQRGLPTCTSAPFPPVFQQSPSNPKLFHPTTTPLSYCHQWTYQVSGFKWTPGVLCHRMTHGTVVRSFQRLHKFYWWDRGSTHGQAPASWGPPNISRGGGMTPHNQRHQNTTVFHQWVYRLDIPDKVEDYEAPSPHNCYIITFWVLSQMVM